MDELVRQADKWFQSGEIYMALAAYEEILARNPNLAHAHNSKGVCLARLGSFDLAYQSFKTALNIEPEQRMIFYNLAQVSRFLGREDEAGTYLESYRALSNRGCPYFQGLFRDRVDEISLSKDFPEGEFHSLLSQGFRRTGRSLSQNICTSCSRCIQIRLLPQEYTPSVSQRRVKRRAKQFDLRVTMADHLTQDKIDLFNDYVVKRHQWEPGNYYPTVLENHEVWNGTLEMDTYDGDRLVSVGLVDRAMDSLYASGFYFNTEYSSFSPGILNLINWLDWGKENGIKYFYLGEYLEEKTNMVYKKFFHPHEILLEGRWVRG